MRVAVGSDHRGYLIKGKIVNLLQQLGHEVRDVGTHSTESVDYPDYAYQVGTLIQHHETDRGILVCGTGIGMCIAANKVPGVRAATCHDEITAELSRSHNDVNILCLPADTLGESQVERVVKIWLDAQFQGGRHERRLDKVRKIEAEQLHPPQSQG